MPSSRRRPARSLLALLLAASAATGLVACGDGDSTEGSPTVTGAAALRGEQLAQDNGCQSCHTTNGKRSTGPTWKDLAGSEVELDGGERVLADDAYLARAITDPEAEVVAGFPSIMPSAYDFTDDEVADLVAYLNELSATGAPAPADEAPAGSSTTSPTATSTTPAGG